MNKKYILVGSGGHSRVIYELACKCNIDISFISVHDDCKKIPDYYSKLKVLTDNEVFSNYSPDDTNILLGIGYLPNNTARKDTYLKYKERGYKFPAIVHPSVVMPKNINLHEGCQIMSGVILQPGVTIGENTIINTSSSIDHDVMVGAHSHVAPGVTICGNVTILDYVFIGAGATIINGIHIKSNMMISAGTTVTKSIQ